MDFDDSPEDATFRAQARSFLGAHAEPRPADRTLVSFFADAGTDEWQAGWIKACRDWQGIKFRGGFGAISWPKTWGGAGGSLMEEIIFAEEEEKYDVPTGGLEITLGMIAPTLLAHGTDQQRSHLRPMLSGEELWCQLFSEPGAGSDLAALQTRAVRDGDGWRISGQKVWTSHAHHADWGYLLTRAELDKPKHQALTAFVLPMGTPGVTVRPLRQMTGDTSFNEVFFDDVWLPDASRLGASGEGWRVAVTTLMNERVSIGGSSCAARSLEGLRAMIESSGRGRDPVVRRQVAEVFTEVEIMRFNRYRVLSALSRGSQPGPESSIGKLSLIRALQAIDRAVTDVLGPWLALTGTECDWVCGLPGVRIGGGTDEVMRNIVAERVLGLPKAL